MVSLLHRLRVAGRGWRVAAWALGVLCVLSGVAWIWSGWHYLWIGGEVNGVLIDEGQIYVTAVRKEWRDMLSVRETYGESWRPIYEPRGSFRQIGQGGSARWRWLGRTPGLMMLDPLMPGLVRASCPLWGMSLVSGASAAGCVWMSRRARVRWAGRCTRCGYDVRSLSACPECGEHVESKGRKADVGSGDS